MRFFNRTFLTLSAVAAFSAASILAQGPGGPGRFAGDARSLSFLSTALDLTDAQQEQAKTIHVNERAASKPIMQELQTQRQAVEAAIQAGKSADEVAALAAQEAPLLGQLEGIRASARQQLFSIMTPAQQKKFTALHQHGPHGGGGVANQ